MLDGHRTAAKEKEMKNKFTLIYLITILLFSCTSVPVAGNRELSLGGDLVFESDFGGTERWYAVDKYNYDSLIDKIRFQVGYFKETNIGFVLYEDGTIGEEAFFSRDGLDLRWDWGTYKSNGYSKFRYTFIIEPDGTGLYYDFSTSTDGIAKPRGIYRVHKF